MIENLDTRREIAERMKIMRGYTHAILTRTSEKLGIGTAVAFRLGDRLFLITAGHNFEDNFEIRLFTGEGPSAKAEVLSCHFHPDSHRRDVNSDFGFIEIRDVKALPACHIEQLHVGEPTPQVPNGNVILFIAGCPEVGYAPFKSPPEVGLSVIPGWLLGGDEEILRLGYDRKGHALSPTGCSFEEADFFETPKGFSGGGVWSQLRVKEGELFLPQKHIKMCGTQFQWDKQTRVLKAMRPRVTLPFFFEKYPELRAEYGYVLR